MDQPHTVAFTVFADAWPRAIETEIGATLCAIGRGKDFDFDLTKPSVHNTIFVAGNGDLVVYR